MRVLVFFGYVFGFVFAVPFLAVALVQTKYGLIDGPPSYPLDPLGEQLKSAVKYGIFVWAIMQFFLFGRVASWAGGTPAAAGIKPISAQALIGQLLELNQHDVPYTISRGSRDNELIVDWRYADAKWLDLMRIHGIREAYRLVLRLDDTAHKVRAQDRYSSVEWSAGRGPTLASLKWQASLGISFYDYRRERIFGLHFKDGKPSADLSYEYEFNLNELKSPMIGIIRNAGWDYRPVITFFRPIGG